MSIKLKLTLPLLAGLVLIVLLIQVYWKPMQLEKAKQSYEKHTYELLVLGESGITPFLLERDFGSLYSSLERLEVLYSTRWKSIAVYDDNDKQIYPVFALNSNKAGENSRFIHIVHPLVVAGSSIGRIELDAVWTQAKLDVIENINGVRNTVIWMVLISMLISTASQYRIIYLPLKKLKDAAKKIALGNFDVELPSVGKDEIGQLTNSFNVMMNELSFRKAALDEHAVVSTMDQDGVITYINGKFIDLSGYTQEELIGKSHQTVRSFSHPPEFYRHLQETISQGVPWHGEICNQSKTGKKYWVSSTIIPFLDEFLMPQRYISIQTDITKQKKAEEQLRYIANHDNLTGLPTRRLCLERLSMTIAIARREKHKVAVLFIDLDGFKTVNDTLGHDAGDLLLVGVAERLSQCVREVDTVARIGGDEFMIVLANISKKENATLVAQKIIDTLSQPFVLNPSTANIGVSIGISLYPDHGQEPEALIKKADEMMYSVKAEGKNNYCLPDDIYKDWLHPGGINSRVTSTR